MDLEKEMEALKKQIGEMQTDILAMKVLIDGFNDETLVFANKTVDALRACVRVQIRMSTDNAKNALMIKELTESLDRLEKLCPKAKDAPPVEKEEMQTGQRMYG